MDGDSTAMNAKERVMRSMRRGGGLDRLPFEISRGAFTPSLGEMYCTIFETVWQLRGMEAMLMDFLVNEEMAYALCNRLGEIRCRQSAIYAGLGVDVIRLGDDVATQHGLMMSPTVYRRFLKEPTRRIIRAAKEVNPDVLVFMHCDGKVGELIEDYLDIGVDILNPIQPECNDFDRIADLNFDRISFWGGIGTQSLMPFGTPDDVRGAVAHLNDRFGSKGGMLIAPSHILEPEVPWANVTAFVNAVKDQHS